MYEYVNQSLNSVWLKFVMLSRVFSKVWVSLPGFLTVDGYAYLGC